MNFQRLGKAECAFHQSCGSAHRLRLDIRLPDPQACKVRPIPPEQKYPEERRQYRQVRHRRLHCQVISHDVRDHGRKQRQRQNHIPVDEQQNARNQLRRCDEVHVMRVITELRNCPATPGGICAGRKLKNPFKPNRQNINPRRILAIRTAIFTRFTPQPIRCLSAAAPTTKNSFLPLATASGADASGTSCEISSSHAKNGFVAKFGVSTDQ